MARTPKAARGKLSAADIKASLATPIDPPTPARRGRKPRLAETPAKTAAEPLATMDTDDVVAELSDADAGISAPSAKPARGRPGPKPKPRGVEAAPPVQQVKRKPGRPPRNPAPAPEPAEDVPPSAELASPVSAPSESAAVPRDTVPDTAPAGDAPPSPASPKSASPVKPAAQWDRATDTAQFDWAAIEQTASQDGPNQILAKLLIAARAEGANSRWPL